jgi:hypothetical protein
VHGVGAPTLAGLVRAGLATAAFERMKAGGQKVEVIRYRITASGRRALEALLARCLVLSPRGGPDLERGAHAGGQGRDRGSMAPMYPTLVFATVRRITTPASDLGDERVPLRVGREDLHRPLLHCRNRPPQRPERSYRHPRRPGTTRGRRTIGVRGVSNYRSTAKAQSTDGRSTSVTGPVACDLCHTDPYFRRIYCNCFGPGPRTGLILSRSWPANSRRIAGREDALCPSFSARQPF